MKTTILQEELLKGLATVSRFVSSRAQLPILANALISAQKGKLKLSATNLEMGITLFIGAKIEEEGSITIPAKLLLDLVSTLPPGHITFETNQDKLSVKTSSFSAVLGGIASSEFPTVPDESKKQNLFLSGKDISYINKKIAFSSSHEDTRPVLTGVLFEFGEKNFKTVATDGFRLSLCEIEASMGEMDGEKLLIPAKTIEELTKILQEEDVRVGVSILTKERQVLFSTDSIILAGRMLEGVFPNYERIIPKEWTYRAYVGKDELIRSIRAAGVIAKESSGVVRVDLKQGSLLIFAENQQYGKEEVSIEAKSEGEEVKVAFNYKYILDFLTSVSGEEVLLETAGNASPVVLRDTKDNSYLHLIMPVRVQD